MSSEQFYDHRSNFTVVLGWCSCWHKCGVLLPFTWKIRSQMPPRRKGVCRREHGPEELKAARRRHCSRLLASRSVLPISASLFTAALALILTAAVAVISAAAAGGCPDGEVAVEPPLERLPQLRELHVPCSTDASPAPSTANRWKHATAKGVCLCATTAGCAATQQHTGGRTRSCAKLPYSPCVPTSSAPVRPHIHHQHLMVDAAFARHKRISVGQCRMAATS